MNALKITKQPVKLPISDEEIQGCGYDSQKTYHKHSVLLPNSIRCIICGPSNCGKTNVVIHKFIGESKWITF